MTSESRPHTPVSLLRRVIVWVIVASFGLAALGGIIVLLGGSLGETAGKVLLTTATVGGFSVAVLCCAALLGRRLRVFGLTGVIVSLLTLAWSLLLIWGSSFIDFGDPTYKILWTGLALTAAFSLASLLLLLADRQRVAVRVGLWVTLGLFAVVLALTVYVIWAREIDSEVLPRVLGIAGILAALGAVVVPVLSLLLRDPGAPGAEASADASAHAIATRVRSAAAARGMTVEEFLADVVDRPAP
jgi:hypothetical protein